MLLIPFVENSFKHGAQIDGVLKVDIKLSSDENWLFFEVSNSSKLVNKIENGIGLENSKKRLEMLYPNNYDFKIEQKEHQFKVFLKVNINGLKSIKNV